MPTPSFFIGIPKKSLHIIKNRFSRHQISPYDKRADGRTERYEDGKMDGVRSVPIKNYSRNLAIPSAFHQLSITRNRTEFERQNKTSVCSEN